MNGLSEWEGLALIVLAGALGAAVGLEREQAEKAAGLRTHLLVATAAGAVVVLGRLLLDDTDAANADPARSLHAVVTGIGFLCAGAIITDRSRGRVQGLTTAASLFFTATIGLAAGLGYLVVAVGATVLALIVLRVLSVSSRRLRRKAAAGHETGTDVTGE